MDKGFIKIHRNMLDWEWYDDINTKVLFIHLLIKANYKDKRWRGIDIKRGQLLTSREALSFETGLSVQSIRTSLNRLKSTNEVTIMSTSKYSVIELKNYNKYQSVNQQDNQQLTSNQPTANQQVTTTKERKERKERKKERKSYGKNDFDSHPNSGLVEVVRFWNGEDENRTLVCTRKQKNPTCKIGNPILSQCIKINKEVEEAYNKVLKDYEKEDVLHAIKQYAIEFVNRRDDRDGDSYCEFKWNFPTFMKRESGFRNFVNSNREL